MVTSVTWPDFAVGPEFLTKTAAGKDSSTPLVCCFHKTVMQVSIRFTPTWVTANKRVGTPSGLSPVCEKPKQTVQGHKEIKQ